MNSAPLVEILLAVMPKDSTFEYFASPKSCEKLKAWCVWTPSGEGSEQAADDSKAECSIQYDVEIWARTPQQELLENFEQKLNEAHISFIFEDSEYDEELELIHYTYTVEI